MQIQRLDDGGFLVHIECDLRSVHERKIFIAKDEDGLLKNPENVPIIVRLSKDEPVTMDVLVKICKALNCNVGDIMDVINESHDV